MLLPTPVHSRTFAACRSFRFKDWGGYLAVAAYDPSSEVEYYAVRHGCGLFDVSPLRKYDISGPDAGAFLSYLTVRDVAKLAVGRVSYLCWCNDDGQLIDDGTVTRIDAEHYRLTATLPGLHWVDDRASGFNVTVSDVTDRLVALALQGPQARGLLEQLGELNKLRFFRSRAVRLAGLDCYLTRTGYTGDLGYEIWADAADGPALWDALLAAGAAFGLRPAGLEALDICRIEAGFVLNGIDYRSALQCHTAAQSSTPYECGLGWAVDLEREPFVGQAALRKRRGEERLFGVVADWPAIEALFRLQGLPPTIPSAASREGVPLYDGDGCQIGRVTSRTWSPQLKQYIGIAAAPQAHAVPGTRLQMEFTVEYQRRQVPVTVTELPFFDPPRKRSR
ncbi:MAG: aminomethyl transferase family protein [Deltaproteobacteria bacterium]|nr:aminomethyl transferase family protein [Deltaproteobacteria bacterium]